MRLAQPAKLMAVTLITFFFIFNSSPFFGNSHYKTEEITTITGGQADTIEETRQVSGVRVRISERVLELFSDIYAYSSQVEAGGNGSVYYQQAAPDLIGFIAEVFNGQANVVRGVYVEGVFSLPVFQQPEGDIAFVSERMGEITEFQSAARNSVTGLLAHNYLSGDLFYNLELGQEVIIVYGNGTIRRYLINDIQQFERLDRVDLRSSFVELDTGRTLTSDEVFARFYRGPHKVTFQTCLKRYGISNWGLTFTSAIPLDPTPLIPLP
jgi:hypothetical protein